MLRDRTSEIEQATEVVKSLRGLVDRLQMKWKNYIIRVYFDDDNETVQNTLNK